MKLNLTKPLVIFDLETTGLSVTKDKIIQIAILKIFPDDRPNELKTKYINPQVPIPEEVTKITGITDDMVKDAPTFERIAKSLLDFIGPDSDLCGYNSNRFDVPMLSEHFSKLGIDLDMSNRRHIDVKRIFHKLEERKLSDAYKKYIGKDMENAHDAGADVMATYAVLEAMLDYYKGTEYTDKDGNVIVDPLQNDVDSLSDFTKDFDNVDFAGTMKFNKDGVPVFGFGKYQGKPVVQTLSKDKSYYDWIMTKGEFLTDTKKIIEKMMDEYNNKFIKT